MNSIHLDEQQHIENYFSKSVVKNRPTDGDFDTLVKSSLQGILQEALDVVNLDPADCIKPAEIIVGPPDMSRLKGSHFRKRRGKDQYFRYLPLGVTVYNFTEDSLVVFQCNFDPATKNAISICTYEYFYSEIVSFETVTESMSFPQYAPVDKLLNTFPFLKSKSENEEVLRLDFTQKFKLTTTAGTSLSVTLFEENQKENFNKDRYTLSDAQKSINVIRRTIRNKKRSRQLLTTQ